MLLATVFSPSVVANTNPISSGVALMSLANWAQTSFAFPSISRTVIGRVDFACRNAAPAAGTLRGHGVMYAELRYVRPFSRIGKSGLTPRGSGPPRIKREAIDSALDGARAATAASEAAAERSWRRGIGMTSVLRRIRALGTPVADAFWGERVGKCLRGPSIGTEPCGR